MGDFVIIDGDQAIFETMFGAAKVTVKPGTITGTGSATVGGKKVCIAGDEASVSAAACSYDAPPMLGGVGTITIQQLAPDQQATKTRNGKALILKGATFIAAFKVLQPAIDPASGNADPLSSHVGVGRFNTANTTVAAS